MKKLLSNVFVKALAYFLFIGVACSLSLSFMSMFNYIEAGVYTSEKFEYDNTRLSRMVYAYYNRNIVEIENDLMFYSEGDISDAELIRRLEFFFEEELTEKGNLRISIKDNEDERVLYSNVSEGDCFLLQHYYWSGYVSNDKERIMKIELYSKDLSSPDVAGDFLLEAYNEFYEMQGDKQNIILRVGFQCLFLVFDLIFILCAAGHKKDSHNPVFLHRIPLEILAAATVAIFLAGFLLIDELYLSFNFMFDSLFYVIAVFSVIGCIALLALLTTVAARIKTGTLLKTTAVYCVFRLLWRFGSIFAANVSLIWRTLLCFGAYLVINGFLIISFVYRDLFVTFLLICSFNILVLLFLCWRSSILMKIKAGGERLSGGDFETKIDTENMFLDYKKFAESLNSVGNGLNTAVEERMKSEKMKSELITNVSHDLKTPLTSIINYVDLLKKEEINSPKAEEYIEVIDRQSQRLKKLTEDLVFAAKASSGTEKVEIEGLNVSEFVSQSAAEYTEKAEKAGLTFVVVDRVSPETTVKADGRLLWRIMDNVFGNVCKYAQPGTRVYVETSENEKTVTISVKNISRDQLNVSSEELMQRFVRGDLSRSSEGSGLGLSIARDLATLQDGVFDISVDGDLFKSSVTLKKQ